MPYQPCYINGVECWASIDYQVILTAATPLTRTTFYNHQKHKPDRYISCGSFISALPLQPLRWRCLMEEPYG